MADETQASGGQAPAGEQPQAGNAPTQTSNTQQSQPTNAQQPQAGPGERGGTPTDQKKTAADDETSARLERLERELVETRKEAANYRTKAKELDRLREEAENANLSEQEKLQKRADAAEKALTTTRERIGKSELKLAAKEAGIIDPEDAIAHLMRRVSYDKEGEPENVADLVSELKAARPHLFQSLPAEKPSAPARAANTGAPANPPRSSTQTGSGLTRAVIEQMSQREYAQRRAEVLAWLAANPTA